MKTALIIGINGNFGSQMAQELTSRGWRIRALLRDSGKAPSWIEQEQIYTGQAQNYQDVAQAAHGCDLIVYAANPAYHLWQQQALAMLEPSARIAAELRIRLLFPGNVYVYSPARHKIAESSPMTAINNKGEIRIAMEQRLAEAHRQGAQITIVRGGDFLSEHIVFGWQNQMLKSTSSGFQLTIPHDRNHYHYWSYLPDLCANTAKLIEQAQSDFELWHDPGLVLSSHDWQQAFSDNQILLRIKSYPWWLLSLLTPFNPLIREVLKMRYLWRNPLILDGRKMQEKLGNQLQSTPFSLVMTNIIRHH